MTWRERLQEQPYLWDFAQWPIIPVDSLPSDKRKSFLRNKKVITQILNGGLLSGVAKAANLSSGRVSQLLDRALGGERASKPALTKGLIQYRCINERKRKEPLSSFVKERGNACSFKSLLHQVPNLYETFDNMITAKIKDKPYGQRITPQAFHGEFKRVLAEANWPQDQYPYTTESLAYESVRRYLHQRTGEIEKERKQRRSKPLRNIGLVKTIHRAMRAIQIDEHILDLTGRVHLQLNDELIPLRLGRANILVMLDVDTTCALGFHIAPTKSPNQQDMLTLFDNCLRPWEKPVLSTPYLEYAPGAMFPSALGDAFPISFGTVQLDNAFCHKAHSVIDFVCEKYGATLSMGLPANPVVRELVESVFDYINKQFSHRVDSTTGSFPTDKIKESRKNQKKVPIISFQTLIEAISVILTEYNNTPKESLGNASPLKLFQHHNSTHFVRYIPDQLKREWQPLHGFKEVPLHWNRNENRLPHISFQYQRYQGPGLLAAANDTKKIRIEYDRRDIRTLHAFTLDGEDLGEVYAPKSWQRFPHTMSTRQWIHKHSKQYRLNMRDPLATYFHYLLENKDNPADALSLLRVYTEFTSTLETSLELDKTSEPTTLTSPPPTQSNKPLWNLGIANHRS